MDILFYTLAVIGITCLVTSEVMRQRYQTRLRLMRELDWAIDNIDAMERERLGRSSSDFHLKGPDHGIQDIPRRQPEETTANA